MTHSRRITLTPSGSPIQPSHSSHLEMKSESCLPPPLPPPCACSPCARLFTTPPSRPPRLSFPHTLSDLLSHAISWRRKSGPDHQLRSIPATARHNPIVWAETRKPDPSATTRPKFDSQSPRRHRPSLSLPSPGDRADSISTTLVEQSAS